MFPLFNCKEDLARYFDFVVYTAKDAERLENAWHIMETRYKGDGAFGCAAEMLAATRGSKKTTISNAGRIDCYMMFQTAGGAIIPISAERKTNAGRVKTLETEFSRAEDLNGKFVVYSMDVCNASTSHYRRYCPPKVFPRRYFVQALHDLNGIKLTALHGVPNGYYIQSGMKSVWLWACDYPILYERDRVYKDSDFTFLGENYN